MAVDANAVTLADHAIQSNEPRVMNAVFSLHRLGSVLQDIPFVTNPSIKTNGVRFRNEGLGTVGWRAINEEPAVYAAHGEQFSESVYIASNNIDVDSKLLIDRNQISDPRALRFQAWWETLLYDVNDKWINNNPLTGDIDAPVGLRHRLDNPTVWGVETALKINGNGVVMTSALSATNANDFIEILQSVFHEMGSPEGDGCVIYLNELLSRRFERAVRQLGAGAGFNMVTDAFGRSITRYKNAVIRLIGRKKDGSTQIITNTESAAGADSSSTFTSLYVVRYGAEHALGWQMEPLYINDLGLLNNGVTYRINVDHAFGVQFQNTRSMARVYNIKVS